MSNKGFFLSSNPTKLITTARPHANIWQPSKQYLGIAMII